MQQRRAREKIRNATWSSGMVMKLPLPVFMDIISMVDKVKVKRYKEKYNLEESKEVKVGLNKRPQRSTGNG